ncbi:MAG: hypothetical protein ACKO34_01840 [Vampirovibrionales bacterium]
MKPIFTWFNQLSFHQRFWLSQLVLVPTLLVWGSWFVLAPVQASSPVDIDQFKRSLVQPAQRTAKSADSPQADSLTPAVEKIAPTTTNEPLGYSLPITQEQIPYTKVHITNPEYPPRRFAQYPPNPVEYTHFTAFLNEALSRNGGLKMVDNIETADYRVEIRCSGLVHCGDLQLNLYDAKRTFLNSVMLPANRKGVEKSERLYSIANSIAKSVHKQIASIPMGGYGAYDHE